MKYLSRVTSLDLRYVVDSDYRAWWPLTSTLQFMKIGFTVSKVEKKVQKYTKTAWGSQQPTFSLRSKTRLNGVMS
jgi:hypothetical protein